MWIGILKSIRNIMILTIIPIVKDYNTNVCKKSKTLPIYNFVYLNHYILHVKSPDAKWKMRHGE